MRNKRVAALLVAALPFVSAAQARAEAPVWKEGWLSGLEFSLAPNYYRAQGPYMGLQRADAAIGVGYSFAPWLKLQTKLHVGHTHFSFRDYGVSEGTTLSGDVSGSADVSVEFGLSSSWRVWKGLSLEGFANYEVIPYRPNFTINGATLDSPLGVLDVTDYARQHAGLDYRFDKLNVGAGASWRLGRWIPRLRISYLRLSGSFRARLDSDAAGLVAIFGYDARKAPDLLDRTIDAVAFAPGLTVELPRGLAIDLEVSTTPVGDSWFFTGTVGLVWRPKRPW